MQVYVGLFQDKGAATPVYCATAPELAGLGGEYLEVVNVGTAHPSALDEATAKKLWELSEEMIRKWKEKQTITK